MTMIMIPIVVILLAAALGGLFAAYHKTFYSPHRNISETDSSLLTHHPYADTSRAYIRRLCAQPCEFVTTRSYDGLRLSARYYAGDSNKPLCICFHGYRGSAVRDFSGLGLHLIDEGYRVLLVDERAHWRSGGHTITFGVRERRDVLSWLGYANDRFGTQTPIYIFGISMGGGTVLMASGLALPSNVRGIVADCPFNAPMDIILHVCRKLKLNPTLCRPIVRLAARVYGRFDINAVTAADAVRRTTVPILIIHGEGDDFVPMSMNKQVRDANPAMIEMHTFPEAGHGLSYLYDTERYQQLIEVFIHKTR